MTLEQYPNIERLAYEAQLYGYDVYFGFAGYCFWRTVVATQCPWWLPSAPTYFLEEPHP